MNLNSLFSLIVISIFILSQLSCTFSRNEIPNHSRLDERIHTFYLAESQKDSKTWYSCVIPEYRSRDVDNESSGSLANWDSKPVNWGIVSIRKLEADEIPNDSRTVVAVSMDVTIEQQGKRIKVSDQTDYWELREDDWYWKWRGWPND